MSFKKNKYQVIKSAISKELANFCYQYFLNKRMVARHLFDENIYPSLPNTLVYGMIHKYPKHIHIMQI